MYNTLAPLHGLPRLEVSTVVAEDMFGAVPDVAMLQVCEIAARPIAGSSGTHCGARASRITESARAVPNGRMPDHFNLPDHGQLMTATWLQPQVNASSVSQADTDPELGLCIDEDLSCSASGSNSECGGQRISVRVEETLPTWAPVDAYATSRRSGDRRALSQALPLSQAPARGTNTPGQTHTWWQEQGCSAPAMPTTVEQKPLARSQSTSTRELVLEAITHVGRAMLRLVL
jgi:hypothetical protein